MTSDGDAKSAAGGGGQTPAPATGTTDDADGPDEAAGTGAFASPPCFMHELDPSYLGQMSREEMLDLLNRLLEAERAGARGVGEMSAGARDTRPDTAGDRNRATLGEIAKDEARFCAMLSRHIRRLGGTPSSKTGTFYDKLIALKTLAERLDFLDRGQGWVVAKLRDALPRIGDDALHRDLKTMLDVHERNIRQCAALR